MEIVFASLSEEEIDEMEAHIYHLPNLLGDDELIGVAPAKVWMWGSGLLVVSDSHMWYIGKYFGKPTKFWDADFSEIASAHWSDGKLVVNKQGAFSQNLECELIGEKSQNSFSDSLAEVVPLTQPVGSPSKLSNNVEWRISGAIPEEKEDAIDRALKNLSVFEASALSKGEIKELPNILWEDELPVAVITGRYRNGNGILVATGRRLIFVDKGLIGLTVEDFYYEDISSIESHQGWIFGTLTIYARGNKESVEHVPKKDIRPFSDLLRNELAKSKQMKVDMLAQTQQVASIPTRADNIDALFKLAELHKMDVLTDDEFAEQKAKFLKFLM